jgi:hypothetical protein
MVTVKNGPITQQNGVIFWYVDDKLHREEGPAVESESGFTSWWLNDEFVSDIKPQNWDELVQAYYVRSIMEK